MSRSEISTGQWVIEELQAPHGQPGRRRQRPPLVGMQQEDVSIGVRLELHALVLRWVSTGREARQSIPKVLAVRRRQHDHPARREQVRKPAQEGIRAVSYTHLRAHETVLDLV